MIPAPPTSTLFPYTTLFRSKSDDKEQRPRPQAEGSMQVEIEFGRAAAATNLPCGLPPLPIAAAVDTYRRARLTIALAPRQGKIKPDKAIDCPSQSNHPEQPNTPVVGAHKLRDVQTKM